MYNRKERRRRFISFVLYTNIAEANAKMLFFSLFQNQATPLAHHHYRLTGTRRIPSRYFQYMYIHIYTYEKRKTKYARISFGLCPIEKERKRHTDLIEK
jgi:hypothetical protein